MKIKIGTAAAHFALIIGVVAVVADPAPKSWAAYVLVLFILMTGIFVLVTGPMDILKRAGPLTALFASVAVIFDFLTSMVVAKREFLDGALILYPYIVCGSFVVALLYATSLKIIGNPGSAIK